MKDTIIMAIHFPKTLLLSTSILVLSACAGTQPNLEIAAAQERLSTAYKDKEVVDRGQADLTNASNAIRMAQDDWSSGRKEKAAHQLSMGQTYLDLAETRGQQAKVEKETVSLKSSNALENKQSQLNASQAQLAGKQMQLSSAQAQIADRDQKLLNAQDQLRIYNMQINELGSTLVLQDVSFETGKADLRVGAANRLQPMINYLQLSETTRVRIEGHTDNVGGLAYNQTLSLNRANAVKMALVNGNVNADRIETVGSGYGKPVGSNKTVSGRESNRRVEITLLK
jgi:outer membrane protein OmpA-like peptidoglycan-associated protein